MRFVSWSAALVGAFVIPLAACQKPSVLGRLVRRQESFEVTSPAEGDTVPVGDRNDERVVPIEWTVPIRLSNRPVMVTLRQGDTIDELATVAIIWRMSHFCLHRLIDSPTHLP